MKNLFKLFALASIVLAITFTTSSCKKGENDPGISFRSRTSRLSGEWTLSTMNYKNTYISDNYSNTKVYSYDGTVRTETSTTTYAGTTNTNINTDAYSDEVTFEKDGTFSRTIKNGKQTTTYKGNWMWVNGNDNQGLKNKQTVLLSITKYTHNDGDGNTSYSNYEGKTNFSDFLVLDRLANDELIVIYDTKDSDDDGSVSTTSGTKTYTQK